MKRIAAALLALIGMGAGLTGACATEGLSVLDAWISAPPPGVTVSAAYLEIRNPCGASTKLVRVTSPRVENIEVHLSEVKNGVAGMRRQDAVIVPAGASVHFEPRGLHLMLINPAPPLQPGETVPLSFEFSDGTVLGTTAVVRQPHDPDSGHTH